MGAVKARPLTAIKSVVRVARVTGPTLLAVGPSGASNEVGNPVIDVIDSSAVGSRATVSGPALSAIVNVVVDAGVINRPEGE